MPDDLIATRERIAAGHTDAIAELERGLERLADPDIAAAFPSAEAVNEALRGVLNTTRAVRGKGGLPNKALQPTSRGTNKARARTQRCAARG